MPRVKLSLSSIFFVILFLVLSNCSENSVNENKTPLAFLLLLIFCVICIYEDHLVPFLWFVRAVLFNLDIYITIMDNIIIDDIIYFVHHIYILVFDSLF